VDIGLFLFLFLFLLPFLSLLEQPKVAELRVVVRYVLEDDDIAGFFLLNQF
jgi:hypothetical protein